jgi:hypothetical protein
VPVEVVPAGFSTPPHCPLRTDFAVPGSRPRALVSSCDPVGRITCPENNPVETEHHGGRPSCGDRGPEENLVAEAVEPADEVSGGALARLLIEEGFLCSKVRKATRSCQGKG